MEKYKYATTFNQDGTLVVNLYNDDYKQYETGSYYLYENVTIKEVKGVLEIEFEKCLEFKRVQYVNLSWETLGKKEIDLESIIEKKYSYNKLLVKDYPMKSILGFIIQKAYKTLPTDALVWKYIDRGFNKIKTNVYKIKYFN